jgi:uncharacterized 2Fe-2S/4Fe-4S cluster protein (DUF4445 family)
MRSSTKNSFIIEFQPSGLRLILDEPTTLLDAARQAGVMLRAECGGKGTCGKCRIKILSDLADYPASQTEDFHLGKEAISEGYRLACETIILHDLKVFVPQDSFIEGQILQTEGRQRITAVDPAVIFRSIILQPAELTDLRSDFRRIKDELHDDSLCADLQIIRDIPQVLRKNRWKIDLIIRGNEIITLSSGERKDLIGLAVDVGSTKLACYLVDLRSGETLAARGTPNPQIAYGEDIMARIAFAQETPENALLLQKILFESINETSRLLTKEVGLNQQYIADACLVGNTVMHHLFLKLPIDGLAVSPFVPVFNDPSYQKASELGLTALAGCGIYSPPVIAGFVGSDHLAFLLAEGFGRVNRIRLGIDIGTNTEIAIQKNGQIVSVSTASGPAFEGAHLQYGMRAAPGAIEHLTLDERGNAEIQVIGDKPPTGICGSGILDSVAEMRRIGLLNTRGRMVKSHPGVQLDEKGKPYFKLSSGNRPVTMTQHDVDQILLAKGAIRAGIDVLMDYLNVKPKDIDEVVIAGAFGTYMLPEQAMRIGMLPEIPLEKVQTVGNAAGSGARMMLISKSARAEAERLAKQIHYLELTIYPEFPVFYAMGIQA